MSKPLGVPANYVHLLGHRCLQTPRLLVQHELTSQVPQKQLTKGKPKCSDSTAQNIQF